MAHGKRRQHQDAQDIINQVAESTNIPREVGEEPPERPRRRFRDHAQKRPSEITIPVGDGVAVVYNNFGNKYGVGVQVDFPGGRGPTEDEVAIIKRHVKGEDGEATGFRWDKPKHLQAEPSVPNMWHKEIGEAAPGKKAVAIRLDTERRVQQLADDFKAYYRDKQGFVARLQQEREQAEGGERTPF
jgi:hypothetical protein